MTRGSNRLTRRLRRVVGRRGIERSGSVVDEQTKSRLDRQHRRVADVERELKRIGPQIAALEARFEDLRVTLERPQLSESEASVADALVAEVRREHQRIRARVSAAARFEERLRLLEETVSTLQGTDAGPRPPST